MRAVASVNEADLARARSDPTFRRKLLAASLETLLDAIKRARDAAPKEGPDVRQLREGVELAVRLAELIQTPARETPLSNPPNPRSA